MYCYVRLEWIYTLQLPQYHGTPCSKQVQYLIFKWLQPDSKPQALTHKQTLKHLAKLAKWMSHVVGIILYGSLTVTKARYLNWSDCDNIWSHNHLLRKRTINLLGKLPKRDWAVLWIRIYVVIIHLIKQNKIKQFLVQKYIKKNTLTIVNN